VGQLFDLAGDGIEALVDFGEVAGFARRQFTGGGGRADPIPGRATGAFPDGRIHAFSAP
jgi:hypothetical protein